jgi:hypothetical protein
MSLSDACVVASIASRRLIGTTGDGSQEEHKQDNSLRRHVRRVYSDGTRSHRPPAEVRCRESVASGNTRDVPNSQPHVRLIIAALSLAMVGSGGGDNEPCMVLGEGLDHAGSRIAS